MHLSPDLSVWRWVDRVSVTDARLREKTLNSVIVCLCVSARYWPPFYKVLRKKTVIPCAIYEPIRLVKKKRVKKKKKEGEWTSSFQAPRYDTKLMTCSCQEIHWTLSREQMLTVALTEKGWASALHMVQAPAILVKLLGIMWSTEGCFLPNMAKSHLLTLSAQPLSSRPHTC